MRYDILILDEAHRFLSDMNVKFLENNKFEQILGLSATITREDERTYDRFNLKTIYDYTQADAIKNKDLCEYNLINVGVDLTEAEQKQYKANDEIIKALVPKFKDNIFSGKWSPEKTKLRKAINARKSILYGAENKVNRTVRIIEENAGGKIIVFSEYIYTVNELQKALKEKGIESMVYHSKSKSSDRKIVIEDFRDGKCNVMLSVRALDEGFDMIETNIGIILAGNKTARQIIQRIGRILRYKDEPAKIYQLFTRSTVETKWLMERLGFIKGYNELKYE
jgi:superfamily II DNA or RNA helicase